VVVFAMPLWVPVLVVITLAIWLADRANPFYRQERVGRYGRVFKTWKFRSMVPDAEHVLQERLEEDSVFKEQWENDCKLKDDPRITAVGRLLRRTSLDELPQLFNVLVFEMSLVGPRPLPQYHHQQLARPVRDLREQVLPGITGLWQVSGRSESGTAGMERWDTYYVRNWSPWLDVVILVRTIKAVFSAEGAY
jgi:lipopolysaccharide/colanic/teichoic acid biosynthesis glycosyltransferase